MKNVLKSNINYFWNYYNYMVDLIEDDEILYTDADELKDFLKINYSKALKSVLDNAEKQGKSKKETKYEVLKLHRTIARLKKENVIDGNFNICYSEKDILNEFPLFDKEDFVIEPSEATINKIKVGLIRKNVEEYNKSAKENGKSEISDLRVLKFFLVNQLKLKEDVARDLSRLYVEDEMKQCSWGKNK